MLVVAVAANCCSKYKLDSRPTWSGAAKCSTAARERLVRGLAEPCHQKPCRHMPCHEAHSGCMFADVMVSLSLPNGYVGAADWRGTSKGIIAPRHAFASQRCVVYGAGIADMPEFEADLARRCETHAFDCTVSPKTHPRLRAALARSPNLTFHKTCIGRRQRGPAIGPDYLQAKDKKDGGTSLNFERFAAIAAQLNHTQTQIDLIKFDIEGHEWCLFKEELLRGHMRPVQLAFELHTHLADPRFVSPAVAGHFNKTHVNSLFLALYDLGYRVVSKEINQGDPGCADFVVALPCGNDRVSSRKLASARNWLRHWCPRGLSPHSAARAAGRALH